MFNSLREKLMQPTLYEATKGEFWNDEYISAQMLKAHLSPNLDSASRKMSFIERSAGWIKTVMPPDQYPHLLDIGCGPGLYAERFTGSGYCVTGVDFSLRSIEYAQLSAQRQNLDIDYIYQDYLDLNLDKTFDTATMIYCDYGALSPTNRKILLQKVYKQLNAGGKFLLDVFSSAAYEQFAEEKTWTVENQGGFWRADSYIELQRRLKYPPNTTLEQYTIISKEQTQNYYIWNSYFSRERLTAEVQDAGFKVCAVFGDVSGARYDLDSLTLAVVLEK